MKTSLMFYGNAITGGVFNINMASSQSAVSSPESEPPKKKFRRVTAVSQTVEAAKKIDHDLVNSELSNKVVKK